MIGVWRTMGRGWPAFGVAVLVTAAIQAGTVFPGLVPEPAWSFVLLAIGSFVTCAAAVAVISAGALAISGGRSFSWPRWSLLIGSAVAVIVTAGLSLLSVYLIPLGIVLSLWWLPVLADREGWTAALNMFRHRPWQAIVALVATVVLAVLSWAVAFALGFFVTGVLSAFLTWIWFGAVAVILIVWWTCLYPLRPAT